MGKCFKDFNFFSLTLMGYRVIVAINWKRYHACTYPLHIWIVVGVFNFYLFLTILSNFSICDVIIRAMGCYLYWFFFFFFNRLITLPCLFFAC